MQQTQNYKLNLIESSDTFSPTPLNENMEKLETALDTGLAAEAAARQSADSSLRSRVTTLEGHRIAIGNYTGDGAARQTFYVGFTPRIVLIQGQTGNTSMTVTGFGRANVKIISGGFDTSYNTTGNIYCYCAIL